MFDDDKFVPLSIVEVDDCLTDSLVISCLRKKKLESFVKSAQRLWSYAGERQEGKGLQEMEENRKEREWKKMMKIEVKEEIKKIKGN